MSDVPPSLAALYASEQVARGVPDADRERIRNTVLTTVGVAVSGAAATGAGTASAAAATTATSSIVGKLVVVIVALGAIGGGTALLSRKQSAGTGTQSIDVGKRTVATQPSAPREVVAPLVDTPAPIEIPRTPAPVPPAPVTHTQTPPSPEARAASVPTASKAELAESDARRLARAVALSERGDTAEALAVLDGVASTSALVEERDALRIIVLAKLGRTEEACAAVTSFVARYPQSIHRAAVEEVPCSSVR